MMRITDGVVYMSPVDLEHALAYLDGDGTRDDFLAAVRNEAFMCGLLEPKDIEPFRIQRVVIEFEDNDSEFTGLDWVIGTKREFEVVR